MNTVYLIIKENIARHGWVIPLFPISSLVCSGCCCCPFSCVAGRRRELRRLRKAASSPAEGSVSGVITDANVPSNPLEFWHIVSLLPNLKRGKLATFWNWRGKFKSFKLQQQIFHSFFLTFSAKGPVFILFALQKAETLRCREQVLLAGGKAPPPPSLWRRPPFAAGRCWPFTCSVLSGSSWMPFVRETALAVDDMVLFYSDHPVAGGFRIRVASLHFQPQYAGPEGLHSDGLGRKVGLLKI
ncbi:hypothetical protein V2J09_003185 [Rumex salicifolius]